MSLLFWEQVNKTIKSEKTTQECLANKTGIKFQTLRSWISKDILPRADDAVKIAKELGVTVEYLTEGSHSNMSDKSDESDKSESIVLHLKMEKTTLAYLNSTFQVEI